MQKDCKTCGQGFEIRKEDQIFYDQINMPVPGICPECRMQRRLAFRNERTLYKRNCSLCQRDMVSLYAKNTPFPVYCHDCWWSDGWDPTSFKQDYDKTRPFLEQFQELQNKVPKLGLVALRNINSEYTNGAAENKNCYLIFASENNEDCLYGKVIQRCKNAIDCVTLYDSELCYECIDTRKSFKCMHSERLQECVDVLFSFDMRNCQNCIFCTNGRNLTYCIENKQYTKEEFEKRKMEIFTTYDSIEEAKKKYEEIKTSAIVKYASAVKCNDATGDYIYNCYDGVRIFDAENTKNSSYLGVAEGATDCHDCDNLYFKPERLYNVMSTLQSNNCAVCTFVFSCNSVYYSDSCHNCNDCFGSVGLNKKSYHILNKEYSKEEYKGLKEQIIEELKKEEIHGDFFPPSMSPFGYNETVAQEYLPLTEEKASNLGFNWQKETSGTYGKETIKNAEMPETIKEVSESILMEILVCDECGKNFRLTNAELDFYKRMGLPIPHKDFECRHQARMAKRNPRKLWPRSCMCELKNHQHGGLKCENNFETSYSPGRPEVVYCETCYQQEVS